MVTQKSVDCQALDLEILKTHLQRVLHNYKGYLATRTIYVATDSEWGGSFTLRFANWIQTANVVFYPLIIEKKICWESQVFLHTNPNLSEASLNEIKEYFDCPWITLVFDHQTPQNVIIEQFLNRTYCDYKKPPKDLRINMKYSPLDLTAFFGFDKWVEMLKKGVIEQKKCLKFNTGDHFRPSTYKDESGYRYSIRDIHGLSGESLKKQATSVNVELIAKDTMDEYKSDMERGYLAHPIEASLYNIFDSLQTFEIAMAYIPLINDVLTNVVGLPNECKVMESNLPFTVGSLVAHLLKGVIEFYPQIIGRCAPYSDEIAAWRIALRKHCILKSHLNEEEREFASSVIEAMRACKTIDDYKGCMMPYKKNFRTLYNIVLSGSFDKYIDYKIYEQVSCQHLGSDASNSLIWQAIVQGGRCNNSFPHEYRLDYSKDIDLSSCYGSKLRRLLYAIGLPTTICFDSSKKNNKKFFSVYEKLKDELIPDLWVADVSTSEPLSFPDDLLYSTINVKPSTIVKCTGADFWEGDDDYDVQAQIDELKRIPSDFVLSRKVKVHSKMTSSSVDVLTKVATNRELGEYKRKLDLNSMIYYPKSLMIEDPIEWALHILQDEGCIEQNGNNDKTDTRSRCFCPIPLEVVIGKLVDCREIHKEIAQNPKKTTDDRNYSNAYQEMLKLFINAHYGDLASVFFKFSNALLANVITDSARVGAWKMSKALLTRQEITDGGFYTPLGVAFIEGRKPGMAILSDARKWCEVTGGQKRTIKPLGGDWLNTLKEIYDKSPNERVVNALEYAQMLSEKGVDGWVGVFETLSENWEDADFLAKHYDFVDILAEEHIDKFWSLYDLELGYGINHKKGHTAWKVGYWGKADYYMNCIDNKKPHIYKKRGAKMHRGGKELIEDPCFEFLKALAEDDCSKIVNGSYQISRLLRVAEWLEAEEGSDVRLLLPGVEIVKSRQPRQYNNKHIFVNTPEEWNKINKRRGVQKGERSVWFERYYNNPKRMIKAMNDNRM